jgi:hypothetical protein
LKHAIILVEGTWLLIALVHMDIMEPLVSLELVVDGSGVRWFTGLREFGSKDKQFTVLIAQLLQIRDQDILQIIVGSRAGRGDSHAGWPVE